MMLHYTRKRLCHYRRLRRAVAVRPKNEAIAAIHAGWRGTAEELLTHDNEYVPRNRSKDLLAAMVQPSASTSSRWAWKWKRLSGRTALNLPHLLPTATTSPESCISTSRRSTAKNLSAWVFPGSRSRRHVTAPAPTAGFSSRPVASRSTRDGCSPVLCYANTPK